MPSSSTGMIIMSSQPGSTGGSVEEDSSRITLTKGGDVKCPVRHELVGVVDFLFNLNRQRRPDDQAAREEKESLSSELPKNKKHGIFCGLLLLHLVGCRRCLRYSNSEGGRQRKGGKAKIWRRAKKDAVDDAAGYTSFLFTATDCSTAARVVTSREKSGAIHYYSRQRCQVSRENGAENINYYYSILYLKLLCSIDNK